MLAAPESSALTAHGLPPIGTGWREAATTVDYFASTARLSDGVGAWAMLAARLGDGAANRAFAERWWRGAVRGTDVLFPAGESMADALRRLQQAGSAVDWPTAVARFRAALARVEILASERSGVAAAVTRISDLEQACEEASCFAEIAQARLARATDREPSVRAALAAAEEEHRAALADLGAHELGRPAVATVTDSGKAALRSSAALSVALAGGLRRGTGATGPSLAANCAPPARPRGRGVMRQRKGRRRSTPPWPRRGQPSVETAAEVTRLEAEIGPLAEAVAAARQLWGDHVPDGPSQAETEDVALIEWRETSAPWADDEFATARAEVFLAALELHKALITAQADVFAANLGALMDLISTNRTDADERPDGAVATDGTARTEPLTLAIAAAWQTLFLLVPVVHVPFGAIGTLFADLGPAGLAGCSRTTRSGCPDGKRTPFSAGSITPFLRATPPPPRSPCLPPTPPSSPPLPPLPPLPLPPLPSQPRACSGSPRGRRGTAPGSGQVGPGRRRRPGDGAAESTAPAESDLSEQSAEPAEPVEGTRRIWVGTPLRVARGIDRTTIDLRNELAYDGLLVSDRD